MRRKKKKTDNKKVVSLYIQTRTQRGLLNTLNIKYIHNRPYQYLLLLFSPTSKHVKHVPGSQCPLRIQHALALSNTFPAGTVLVHLNTYQTMCFQVYKYLNAVSLCTDASSGSLRSNTCPTVPVYIQTRTQHHSFTFS